MKNKKSNKAITTIAILIIVSGILSVLYSFPIRSTYTSLYRGTVITKGTENVYIANVQPDSPAKAAGLETGDIILSIENEKITETADVINAFALYAESQTTLTVERNGKTVSITLVPRINPPQGQGSIGV